MYGSDNVDTPLTSRNSTVQSAPTAVITQSSSTLPKPPPLTAVTEKSTVLESKHVPVPFHPDRDCPRTVRTKNNVQFETGESRNPLRLDAIVSVNQYRPNDTSEQNRIATGVVLDKSGYVATALDLDQPLGCIEVMFQNGDVLPARVIALQRPNGAAILEVGDAGTRRSIPATLNSIASETAVNILRADTAGLATSTKGAAASAGDQWVWVLGAHFNPNSGDVVLDSNGALVGVVVPHTPWKGALSISYSGGPPRPEDYPGLSLAIRTQTLEQLLQQGRGNELMSKPVKVHFGGPSSGWSSIGGDPVAIGKKMAGLLSALDEPADIEGLGGSIRDIIWTLNVPIIQGAQLELLYPISQPLETSDGTLVGSARYLMMWWWRGSGYSDLILAGPSPEHITHAFRSAGLEDLWSFAEAFPIPTYPAFRSYSQTGFPHDYPLKWTIATDQSVYSLGETVQISLRAENVSIIPVNIQMPSRFEVFSDQFPYSWDSQFVSDEHTLVVPPGESLILAINWDQRGPGGESAPVGSYRVESLARSASSGAYAVGASFQIER